MLDLVTNLALTRKLEFSNGEIKLFGTNLFLIPPYVYVILLKELEKQNQQEIIYNSSKNSAYNLFRRLSKYLNKEKKEKFLDDVPKFLNLLGLGETKITKSDFDKQIFIFSLNESLNAELYGKTDHPVDLQFAGLLAGSVSFIFQKEFICKELECKSIGFGYCKFEVKVLDNA